MTDKKGHLGEQHNLYVESQSWCPGGQTETSTLLERDI